jgi:hypothetical protein
LMRGETAGIDVNADPNMRLVVSNHISAGKRWKM